MLYLIIVLIIAALALYTMGVIIASTEASGYIFCIIGALLITLSMFLFNDTAVVSTTKDVKTRTLNLMSETKEVEIHTFNDGTIYYTLTDSTYKKLFNYLNKEEK